MVPLSKTQSSIIAISGESDFKVIPIEGLSKTSGRHKITVEQLTKIVSNELGDLDIGDSCMRVMNGHMNGYKIDECN